MITSWHATTLWRHPSLSVEQSPAFAPCLLLSSMSPVASVEPLRVMQRPSDVGATLSWFQHGRHDPTTWLAATGRGPSSTGHFVRATLTPEGPGTLALHWNAHEISIESYGPGSAWLRQQARGMAGADDSAEHGLELSEHPVVAAAALANRFLRIGASNCLYHELVPTILEQRVTVEEAHRQWRQLCGALGDPAPGPFARLLLPPDPALIAQRPSWWFHKLGIERHRANALISVARHASKFWCWSAQGASEVSAKLRLILGVGEWTIGSVLGPAIGDPDAVAVGDYHLKNMIAFNLAGESRGTDDRMLELLEPYTGQRGRVVQHLARYGSAAPKRGPKRRLIQRYAR